MLETERLLLRTWELTDAPALYEYARDTRIGPRAGWPAHQTVAESEETIRAVFSAPHTFALTYKEQPNHAIGAISVMLNRPDLRQSFMKADDVELGYWLGVPHWGKGLMPEAVKRIIQYAYEEVQAANIWCAYYEGNEQSRRVQEKMGFRYVTTIEEVSVPLLNETRIEHFLCLSKENASE